MTITSKVDICNMALSHLGNYDSVEDIDTPVSEVESTFALWYDTTREAALRFAIPNFAKSRRLVSKKSTTPAFGYSYAYEYPSDALRVLGFGDIDEKDLDYNIELDDTSDTVEIQTDHDFTSGMKLRFIKDVTDVNRFTSDFKILLSWMLAANVALDITQDAAKAQAIEQTLPSKISQLSGISAQENPPVRKSTSKFKQARFTTVSRNNGKK